MPHSVRLLALLSLSFFCIQQNATRVYAGITEKQGVIFSGLPRKVDTKARYLFYLHGKIVEQGRRPVSPQYGVYEYDQILEAFRQGGFVVVSEQRRKDANVEQYGAKVARQVRRLIKAGVAPQNITVVGASQGSWMAMFASTYLRDSRVNFVFIAACSADEGFERMLDLHGHLLFIYERTDLPGSCQRFRSAGVSEYKEIELNTGLRHGFLYRPMKEWVEPTVEWARSH
ncbi:MAG: alpha/beta hydrolase [Acidobacteriota bacterium]|nr:alpha/beta hydrolase [Acidobacteriota bacterium]